jgi:hypothetical protein
VRSRTDGGGNRVLRTLDFPLLRSQKDFENGAVPASLEPFQDDLLWAEHIIVWPLSSRSGNDGHARCNLSMVLSRPQCQIA